MSNSSGEAPKVEYHHTPMSEIVGEIISFVGDGESLVMLAKRYHKGRILIPSDGYFVPLYTWEMKSITMLDADIIAGILKGMNGGGYGNGLFISKDKGWYVISKGFFTVNKDVAVGYALSFELPPGEHKEILNIFNRFEYKRITI